MGRPKARYNNEGQKECSFCRVFKPVIEFNHDKRSWDRRERICKTCRAIKYAAHPFLSRAITQLELRKHLPNIPHQNNTKLCARCRKWIPLIDFSRDKSCWDGLRPYCKKCCHTRRITAARNRGHWLQGKYVSTQAQIICNLRSRLWHALKGHTKSAHTVELIGCSIDDLKHQFETQFKPGMSWDNYGRTGWHIGHIRDCCSFDLTDPKQQRECFNFSNLEPQWAKDNLSKPRDKKE